MEYLTIKEKKELIMQGKEVPLCVSEKQSKIKHIVKSRNIFDYVRHKQIKL